MRRGLRYVAPACLMPCALTSHACRFLFHQARQESEKKRLMEEKAARRKAAQEEAAQGRFSATGALAMTMAKAGGEDENLVDNILGTHE